MQLFSKFLLIENNIKIAIKLLLVTALLGRPQATRHLLKLLHCINTVPLEYFNKRTNAM
jgi:hypothetical protein